jgi:hypothetical protein
LFAVLLIIVESLAALTLLLAILSLVTKAECLKLAVQG